MSDTVISLWKGSMTRRETMAEILAEVAEKRQVSVADLIGPARTLPLVYYRHEAMAEIRRRTTLSFPQIARRFGKDHTTVLHGARAHERRMAEGR